MLDISLTCAAEKQRKGGQKMTHGGKCRTTLGNRATPCNENDDESDHLNRPQRVNNCDLVVRPASKHTYIVSETKNPICTVITATHTF